MKKENKYRLLQRVGDLRYRANGCDYSDNSNLIDLIIELADIVTDVLIQTKEE